MKKVLIAAGIVSMIAIGAISTDKKYKLNHYMGKTAEEVALGTLVQQGGTTDLAQDGVEPLKMVVATYDFSVSGGSSAASIDLGQLLPSGAVVRRSFLDVITQPVGSGASVRITSEASGDILASSAVSGLTIGRTDGVSTGSVANMKKMTASRELYLEVFNHDLTAGKFRVYVEYVMSSGT